MSLVDPSYELIDPNPDLHATFIQFNEVFFQGVLASCEVSWSNRMTQCAGLCSFQPRSRYCSIRLSVPLLKLRPRKDFVETLLHEMIHAYLFLTNGNRDRDGHGPEFQAHMHRINGIAGTNITIYHSFHAEVALYKQHWWRCEGSCKARPPFYGWVKRSMNRAPSKNDLWWNQHEQTCGGKFIKVKEPEPKPNAKNKQKNEDGTPKIDSVFPGKGYKLGDGSEEPKPAAEKKKKPTTPKPNTNKKRKSDDGNQKITSIFPGQGYRLGDGSEEPAEKKKPTPNADKKKSTAGTSRIDPVFSGNGYRLGDGTEEPKKTPAPPKPTVIDVITLRADGSEVPKPMKNDPTKPSIVDVITLD